MADDRVKIGERGGCGGFDAAQPGIFRSLTRQ
jgi:hypothetical protein